MAKRAAAQARRDSAGDALPVLVVMDALDDMVGQFAYRRLRRRGKWHQLVMMTGGLSALEHAFDVLGWKDPHIVRNPSPGAIAALERSKNAQAGLGLGLCQSTMPMLRRVPGGQCLRYDGHPDFHIDYRGKRWG